MDISSLQALVLGIVEGVTEYLPVSSTGHLLLTQRLLGIPQSEGADAFAICIQAGAILAVLGLYRQRAFQIVSGFLGRDPEGRKIGINVIAGLLPALALGFILEKTIKKYLFGGETLGLWPIVGAWFVGGVAILAVTFFRSKKGDATTQRKGLESLEVRMAILIGVCQCLAMWPGTSRSLVTIVGGLLVGLSMTAAVEYSFLLGVLTLGAATALDILKHGKEMLASAGPVGLAIGFLSAWISAVLAIKWMVAYLNKHGLQVFGWYRILLAIAVAGLILKGVVR